MKQNQFIFTLADRIQTWSQAERSRFDIYIGGLKDGRYIQTIQPVRSLRSIEQNSFYWGVVLPTILDAVSERNTEPARLELHDELVAMFAPRKKARLSDEMVPIRSSKMKVDEFSEYLENIMHYCITKYGIVFPEVRK